MNRALIYTFSILLGIGIILVGASLSKNSMFNQKCNKYQLKLPEGIDEGDLVFRRGNAIVSRMVLSADNVGSYSHVGIVIKKGDSLFIAHEVPGEAPTEEGDAIQVVPFSDFFSKKNAEAGAIMTVYCSETQKAKALQSIKEKIALKIPFDHKYDLSDTSKLYCTELIWLAYKKSGIDLTDGRRTKINIPLFSGDYILPSDIQKSSYLGVCFSFNQ